eukprot:11200274-Lingulodinium_polyedra.AAC.1
MEIRRLRDFFAPNAHLIALNHEHMVKGNAKAAVAKAWQESTGEGLTEKADESTCVQMHEAMYQTMNVWSAFNGREDQK